MHAALAQATDRGWLPGSAGLRTSPTRPTVAGADEDVASGSLSALWPSVLAAEAAVTSVLVLVIVAVATDSCVPRGIAALAIGAALAAAIIIARAGQRRGRAGRSTPPGRR